MRNIRQLAEKKTWTEEDGQLVVNVWRASGQTIAAFAREQGFGDGRLRWWRDRVSCPAVGVGNAMTSGVAAPAEGPRLVRVDVEESVARPATTGGAWELVTPRGHLRVHDGIGIGELRAVLEALVSRELAP